MSNGRLRLELSDAGSRFRVGDMKGRIWASAGKSAFKMVMVSLIWSVRMVHSVAASGHAALRDRTRRGLECISVAAQNRRRGGQEGGTRRRCTSTLPVDEASDER